MKKYYALLVISVLFLIGLPGKLFSQSETGDHEISLGIGLLSLDEIYGTFAADVGRTIVSLGTEDTDNTKIRGAFSFSYKYFVKNRFAAGLTMVTDRVTGDLVDNSDELTGTFKRHYFTIAPEMKFIYSNKQAFRFYGILGAGITFGSEKTKDLSGADDESNSWTHFNFQITPLGFRFGQSFGIYAELGVGYKGIIAGGISYHF